VKSGSTRAAILEAAAGMMYYVLGLANLRREKDNDLLDCPASSFLRWTAVPITSSRYLFETTDLIQFANETSFEPLRGY